MLISESLTIRIQHLLNSICGLHRTSQVQEGPPHPNLPYQAYFLDLAQILSWELPGPDTTSGQV